MLSDTIEDFLIARSDLAPSTSSDYKHYLSLWLKWQGDTDIADITARDLQGFMYHMTNEYVTRYGGPLSQSGLYNAWCALRSFWRWASEWEPSLQNISKALARPQRPEIEVHPFTKQEIQALLSACFTTALAETGQRRAWKNRRPEAERDSAWLLLLLDTGVRIGELSRLDVGDTDLKRREIHVRPYRSGKKSRARTIPITGDTQNLLLRWFNHRRRLSRRADKAPIEALNNNGRLYPDAPAFILLRTNAGRRMPKRAIAHVLKRLGDRANVQNVHAHRFRHTFAIEYLRGGGDPWTLKDLLGHSTMEMVRRYLHFSRQDYRRIHESASAVGRWRLYVPK